MAFAQASLKLSSIKVSAVCTNLLNDGPDESYEDDEGHPFLHFMFLRFVQIAGSWHDNAGSNDFSLSRVGEASNKKCTRKNKFASKKSRKEGRREAGKGGRKEGTNEAWKEGRR